MKYLVNKIFPSQRFDTLATWLARSINLHEYPHSLSYQDTILANVGVSEIPALASKIDVLLSPTKS
jgi:hypothetical protein